MTPIEPWTSRSPALVPQGTRVGGNVTMVANSPEGNGGSPQTLSPGVSKGASWPDSWENWSHSAAKPVSGQRWCRGASGGVVIAVQGWGTARVRGSRQGPKWGGAFLKLRMSRGGTTRGRRQHAQSYLFGQWTQNAMGEWSCGGAGPKHPPGIECGRRPKLLSE